MIDKEHNIESNLTETYSDKESVRSQLVNDLLKLFGLDDMLNYSKIIKQATFICFLIGIGIIHIFNAHNAVKMVKEKDTLEKEINEIRWQQMSIKSDFLKRSMQSDLEKDMKAIGMESIKTPPYKITVERK